MQDVKIKTIIEDDRIYKYYKSNSRNKKPIIVAHGYMLKDKYGDTHLDVINNSDKFEPGETYYVEELIDGYDIGQVVYTAITPTEKLRSSYNLEDDIVYNNYRDYADKVLEIREKEVNKLQDYLDYYQKQNAELTKEIHNLRLQLTEANRKLEMEIWKNSLTKELEEKYSKKYEKEFKTLADNSGNTLNDILANLPAIANIIQTLGNIFKPNNNADIKPNIPNIPVYDNNDSNEFKNDNNIVTEDVDVKLSD